MKNEGMSFWEKLCDLSTIEFSFVASVIIVLIVAFLKLTVHNKATTKDAGQLLVDFAMDVCAVIITLLISVYLAKNHGYAALLILIMIGITLLCTFLRRVSMDLSQSSTGNKIWGSGVLRIICLILVLGYAYFCYKTTRS